jgi:ElaB/YqjD/DUF883 family membrane-anchored ribosome-binding protein
MATQGKKKPADSDELQERLAALRADLEALQDNLKGLAGDAGDAATAKMNAAINDAMSSVQDVAERVEDWGEDHLSSVRESVREQPLASCALAVLFRR